MTRVKAPSGVMSRRAETARFVRAVKAVGRRVDRRQGADALASLGQPRRIAAVRKGKIMSMLKVVEVLAESETGWEAAAREAVEEAGRTLRNVRSIYIENFQANVVDGRIEKYRINAKITFQLEDER